MLFHVDMIYLAKQAKRYVSVHEILSFIACAEETNLSLRDFAVVPLMPTRVLGN